ncbi:MAG: AAA family ATPase [Alphaproteobacteria bacterium]|nr:AAA family ATPase [Alphaproteobacteria bacterium]
MALYHFCAKIISRSSRNTVSAAAYRSGCKLYDEQTGQSFDNRSKDVEHVELLLPKDAPAWFVEIQKLMLEDRQKGVQAFVDIVESAEKRVDSQVWREFEFALHRELTKEQNMALAREFVEDQLCSRGMAAQLNFHCDTEKKTGEGDYPQENLHCHVLVTTRRLDEAGMNPKKEEAWNKKELLLELRAQWQEYSNFHLKLNGHDVRVDHRSHKDRGIEIEPQPKMGKGVLEMERRGNPENKPDSFVTDKAQDFHDTQLRNLYRIMRKPDVVLDIVSKHHSTFMWADVQKVLHRYVDELPLFQKLEAKLKNSNELLLLKADPERHDIFTTRTTLKAEKSLVENADALGKTKSHGVKEHTIPQTISKADEALKDFGGLSHDQKRAVYHLVDEGQLKCVVGIAGAGKTTALGVCQDIWKAEGYGVYGLAPTGKAAQNLEQGGIPSNTLHKFLKEFEEGRCQYSRNSVLVLDEAGMVDMERFEQLLGAVKQLGVKLIVVGDGAQLQPVEAGPAFRLLTIRLGKSELNTVLRQNQEWQREATVLFGSQDTQAAIQKYMDKGHVHIVEESLPTLHEALDRGDREGVLKLYEVSSRTSSLIYREMMRDINKTNPEGSAYALAKQHQDFGCYMEWKGIQKSSAAQILKEGEAYRSLLEARSLDPLRLANLFVNKKQDKTAQEQQVLELLKKCGLDSLVGLEKTRQSIHVRQDARTALTQAWHTGFKVAPEKSAIMLSFSNRDTNDLNRSARSLLKESGHIAREEFSYNIAKRVEDDFEREYIIRQEKNFSKGDRIVFTQNTKSLGVKNGTMGTITDLNRQKMKVTLDEGKEISFAPNLNPYFDQGWAITIHKSQGTTVDRTYLLASFEMTQNLAYVAMTRHREDVQVFGSSLDFWRPEKLPEALSKSGEKLSPGDYLDADSLNKLMQQDDRLITKIFERVSNELEAMGAVSKKVFWQVADHFLGSHKEKEIRAIPENSQMSVREEVRAEELFQKKMGTPLSPEVSIPEHTHSGFEEKAYSPSGARAVSKAMDAKVVEVALKQNMTSFADDIFSSIGEPYNSASSSSTERRYGKNGHIAVNLKTGAWIDHKNSDMAGGPLHMLTKLKGLGFKEAVEYGASWAGLSQASLSQAELFRTSLSQASLSRTELSHTENAYPISKAPEREDGGLNEEEKVRIDRAQTLWDKGRPLQGTLAERYLREHRKIEGPLSDDLRYLPFFTDSNSKWSFPCLMAGARSPEGEIRAVQLTFLSANTAHKADIPVAKRSFGVLKGSTVTIQEDKGSTILFVAEGIETALSLRSAGVQGTIKASLGISNIKRIVPESLNTPIIICADHDAPDSPTAQSLEKSVLALKAQGLAVTVIKPDKLNEDFNDVLKTQGPQGVREILERSLLEGNSIKGNLPKDLIKIVPYEREAILQTTTLKPSMLDKTAFEKKTVEKGAVESRTVENGAVDKNNVENSVRTPPQKPVEKVTSLDQAKPKQKTVSPTGEMVFKDLTQQCSRKLYIELGEERRDLTPDLIKEIDRQAEKAATFIFHAHTLKGTRASEKQTEQFLQRAKYELDRVPEIRDDLIAGWKKVNSYKQEKDELIAHMIAERQASVEGRMYLEAKQRGLKPEDLKPDGFNPSPTIPDLAKEEIKQNRTSTTVLAEKLATKQRLSESAATFCAKDITRYMEIHGQKPTAEQMSAMAQISRELDKQGYDPSIGTHNIEYLRRRDGDLRLRDWSASSKDLSEFRDFPHAAQDYAQSQSRAKPPVQEKPVHQEVHEKVREMDFSM